MNTLKRRHDGIAFGAYGYRLAVDGNREVGLNVEHGSYRVTSSRVRTLMVPFIFQCACASLPVPLGT